MQAQVTQRKETVSPEDKGHQVDQTLQMATIPPEAGKAPQAAHRLEDKVPPEEGTARPGGEAPLEEDGARPEAAAPQEEATLCSLTRLGTRTAEGVPGEDRQEAAHRTETGMTMIP